MNSLMATGEVGTEIVRYLPDQDAFKIAGVSKRLRDVSYSSRVWIEKCLDHPEWLQGFFLPPAGAGGMVETILHTYRYLNGSYARRLPKYAYRQLLLAHKYSDLVDNYPHVVPGVAIRAAQRFSGPQVFWARQLRLWDRQLRLLCRVCITGVAAIALISLLRGSGSLSSEGRYVYIPPFGLHLGKIFFVSGILCSGIHGWRPLLTSVGSVVERTINDSLETAFLIVKRTFEEWIWPVTAGREIQFVTAVQLVVPRAFQPLTCKVRGMVRSYLPLGMRVVGIGLDFTVYLLAKTSALVFMRTAMVVGYVFRSVAQIGRVVFGRLF